MTLASRYRPPGVALRAVHLCSGIGGLELALRGVARTVAHVEREAFAAACLVAQMEEGRLDPAPVWSDLSTFDGKPWRGVVDLVTAGFPCQPVSLAGKGLGQEDERWLWPEVARTVREVEPGIVFLENVPGLVRRGLEGVLGDLAGLGFDAEWAVFSAAEVGAPHLRKRIFILAAHPERCGVWEQRERMSGGRSKGVCPQGNPESGHHGAEGAMAHPDGGGCEGERESEPAGIESSSRGELDGLRQDIPDAVSSGLPIGLSEQRSAGEESAVGRSGWWSVEPDVGRVVDGGASRVDRLHALGNAVVPATARLAWDRLWLRLAGG